MKSSGNRRVETLFWNVHRKKNRGKKEEKARNRAESGFNVYGVFLVSIGSIRTGLSGQANYWDQVHRPLDLVVHGSDVDTGSI